MKKILFFLLIAATTFAVDVPDFYFQGEEITSFSLSFEFKDVELELDIPSKYSSYPDCVDFSPGGKFVSGIREYYGRYASMLSPGEQPAFSDSAYVKYLLNAYQRGDYNDMRKYYLSKKGSMGDWEDPAQLVYSFGMIRTENYLSEGLDALISLCNSPSSSVRIAACDKYAEIMYEAELYSDLVKTGKSFPGPLPLYTNSIIALSYYKLENYEQSMRTLESYPDHIFNYPRLNDLRAAIAYGQGDYETVAGLAGFLSDNMTFVLADSYLNLNELANATKQIKKISAGDEMYYLKAKYYLAKKLYNDAFQSIPYIKDEKYRLALLDYYVSSAFPHADISYLYKFQLTKSSLKDYPVYYEAMQNLELKNYGKAAELFSKVQSPALASKATFYRGMCLIYIDAEKAETGVIKIMNESSDPVQIAKARFMLAQLYYIKGGYGESLQLLDGCDEDYCRQLKAEIYIDSGELELALEAVEGFKTPSSYLIRALVRYNERDYDGAHEELSNIKTPLKGALHLRMMLFFKDGDIPKAVNILNSNKDYKPILYDGVKELIVLGNYQDALKLLNTHEDLSDDMMVIKAKLLIWSGDKNGAAKIYNTLVSKNSMLYDALYGLVLLQNSSGDELEQIRKSITVIVKSGDFYNKDKLLCQLAYKAYVNQDNVILLQIINNFFPKYEFSGCAGDMYALRAKLFYASGRSRDCLADVERAEILRAEEVLELDFTRAECMEGIDLDKALKTYMKMVDDSGPFKLPAAVKIMDLSPNPNDILGYSRKIQKDNEQLYIEGVRRYVEVIKPKDLSDNTRFISRLISDSNKSLKCAGYFANAKVLNHKGKSKDAANNYYKVYQTDPGDYFSKQAVKNAATIYSKLGMKKEADEMNNLLKKMNK